MLASTVGSAPIRMLSVISRLSAPGSTPVVGQHLLDLGGQIGVGELPR